MKKLLCLCVVLALAGSAPAAQSYWKNIAAGDWETTTNWTSSPTSSNTAYPYRSDGGASVITVTSTTAIAYKLYVVGAGTYPATATDATLEINNGAMLSITRDVFQYSTVAGSKSTITIKAGGTLNALTAGTAYNWVMTGNLADTKSTDTVNVYGTLNLGTAWSGGGGTAAILKLGDNSASTGLATLNIYNGGVVTSNGYSIGTKTPNRIKIELGGYMWINSNRTAYVKADVDAGKILVLGDGTLEYGYDTVKNMTWITVTPEPATVALLGMGALLLCVKRKR